MSSIESLPTGTVTFLFTDVEGSTRLAQQYPDDLPALLARHEEILRQSAKAYHGYIFQMVGDAFCIAFHSAADAVAAAIHAQRSLERETWVPAPVMVRMGIHTGKADLQSDQRYQGYLTLSRVQRLMSAAHGGQVLVSIATRDLLGEDMPEGSSLRDMGERRLRDMVHPEHIYQLIIPDLPADFPPIKALDLHRHNIPAQITKLIGREAQAAEIRQTLLEYRLVTLVGSGGVGKTRLALEVARECLGQFPDGVWVADLAPLASTALVPQTLLSVFNLREDSHRAPLDALIDHLREATLLLVLDNCEHLIVACAEITETVLLACPGLRILATSRESLGIAGEVTYHVASLTIPDPNHLPAFADLAEMSSVKLFTTRAATAKPGFRLTTENAPSVAQICSRLGGIPLAIELAASCVKALSAEQIATRLDDRFRLLTRGARTALPRQQTLRATIDWSYDLLSESERVLFRRLAVFAGGWTLETAEAVCRGPADSLDILDLMTRLVDKSLVSVDEVADQARYHRLETIRQYSYERLLETDEVNVLRDRHLAYYVQFAEEVDRSLKAGDQVLWQKRMSTELGNLRAALEWGLLRDPDRALRIAGASNLFWTAGGFSAEGFRWTQRALAQVDRTPLPDGTTAVQRSLARAQALRGLARLYLSLGDNTGAKRVAEESVALYREADDPLGLAFSLVVLAYPLEFLGERARAEEVLQEGYSIARAEGDAYGMCRSLNRLARVVASLYHDLDLARGYLQESIRLARQAGLRSQEAQAIENLGLIAAQAHDYDGAREQLNEALMIYDELGAAFNVILQKTNLAHLERQLSNYDAALDYYRETIVAFRDIGQRGAVCHQLECFGFIALARARNEEALELFAAANALRESSGTPMTPDEQTYFDSQVHVLRERLTPKQYAATWAQGAAMSMEQAVELAVSQADTAAFKS